MMETSIHISEVERRSECVGCAFWGATIDEHEFEPLSCNHAILPLNARYVRAELDMAISFSFDPDGAGLRIGDDESHGECTATFVLRDGRLPVVNLETDDGYGFFSLQIREDAIPETIRQEGGGNAYATLDIRYDEARTKEKHDLTDEEIEARRDAFRDETREHMEYGYEAVIGDES